MKDPKRSQKEILWANRRHQFSSYDRRAPWDNPGFFTLSYFTIPTFVCFSENDPALARYQREKKESQTLYRGKDFVTCTLQLLTECQGEKSDRPKAFVSP